MIELAAGFSFTALVQQVVSGAAAGAVYASLALALVLIYRAMDVANFAQGEMAMFSTFVAYALLGGDFGLLGTKLGINGAHIPGPYAFWIAAIVAVAASFVAGIVIERVLIRPFEGAPLLTLVIVTLGLFSIVNGLAGFNWGYVFKTFCCPFPQNSVNFGGLYVGVQDIGILAVTVVVLAAMAAFFRYTKLGLAMRAAALYPESSRLDSG